jgi:hypothetical protein
MTTMVGLTALFVASNKPTAFTEIGKMARSRRELWSQVLQEILAHVAKEPIGSTTTTTVGKIST